jgi:hypothetical protein
VVSEGLTTLFDFLTGSVYAHRESNTSDKQKYVQYRSQNTLLPVKDQQVVTACGKKHHCRNQKQ